jgi:hypothetical protein
VEQGLPGTDPAGPGAAGDLAADHLQAGDGPVGGTRLDEGQVEQVVGVLLGRYAPSSVSSCSTSAAWARTTTIWS